MTAGQTMKLSFICNRIIKIYSKEDNEEERKDIQSNCNKNFTETLQQWGTQCRDVSDANVWYMSSAAHLGTLTYAGKIPFYKGDKVQILIYTHWYVISDPIKLIYSCIIGVIPLLRWENFSKCSHFSHNKYKTKKSIFYFYSLFDFDKAQICNMKFLLSLFYFILFF